MKMVTDLLTLSWCNVGARLGFGFKVPESIPETPQRTGSSPRQTTEVYSKSEG